MTTEVTAKVRRIAPAGSFRLIDNDLFTRVAPGCGLGARTFVYGRNGTGKTTFSELLRRAATGEIAVTAEYYQNGGWRKGTAPEAVVRRVHVFNRNYIEKQLSFFLDGSGSSAGILKLGDTNVAAEGARRALEDEAARQSTRLARLTERRAELDRRVVMLKQEAKQRAIDVLGRVLPFNYGTQTFTVAKAHKALTGPPQPTLTDEQLNARLGLLEAEEFQAIQPPEDPLGPARALADRTGEIIARELTNQVSPDLDRDRALADWIEAGLALHPVGGDRCKFCTSGKLSAETRSTYVAHFDRSLADLRSDLQRLQVEITVARHALLTWRDGLPSPDKIMPDHGAEYSDALVVLKEPIEAWDAYFGALATLADRRAEDPYRPLAESLPTAPEPPAVGDLAEVIVKHNVDVGRQASLRDHAETTVLAHLVEQFRPEYTTARHKIPLADRAIARVDGRISRLRAEAEQMRSRQHDVGRMATLINDDLANTFGHVHLRLKVTDDGKGYEVLRSEGPPQNLSEGERHSLALLYFLRSLEADGVVPEQDLVVVDDPVTSLDKDSTFAAYSLVDERTKSFGQIVVLTHDYELFRLFLMRHKKALDQSRGAINKGDRTEAKFPRVQFLETRAEERPSGERGIVLRAMPDRLLNQPTDYHYIFYRIAEAVRLGDDSDLVLLGNAARRLLEGFVAFKAPTGGDFKGKIEHTANRAGVATEFTERIVRFVHGASHRDEPNPSATFAANIPDELGQVLRFIRACDQDHFTDMCVAVAVDLKRQIGAWKRQNHLDSRAAHTTKASGRPSMEPQTASASEPEAGKPPTGSEADQPHPEPTGMLPL